MSSTSMAYCSFSLPHGTSNVVRYGSPWRSISRAVVVQNGVCGDLHRHTPFTLDHSHPQQEAEWAAARPQEWADPVEPARRDESGRNGLFEADVHEPPRPWHEEGTEHCVEQEEQKKEPSEERAH